MNNQPQNKNSGCLISIIIAVLFLLILGSCSNAENEYSKAGEEFGTWVNTDPRGWTDTQTKYFNNFMEWADEH